MTGGAQSETAQSGAQTGLRLVAYPLFFASGMAGLVYEVIWTRMLIYVFGSGIYAVSAVLAAFMAGLALGSLLLGRASDRLRFPLRFYGILECLIGSAGFLLPLVIGRISQVDALVYAKHGQDFAWLTAWRFIISFGILLVPTTLMGATLPVISRAMIRNRASLGLHVGELYAINTAGAVAGAFTAGFFLIERFGVHQTVLFAATLNFFAGLGALMISAFLTKEYGADPAESEPGGDESPDRSLEGALSPAAPSNARLILTAAFLTGFVSIAAQVLWSRSLIFTFEFLKNTTYAFSAMLTIFLAGISLGSALIGPAVDRSTHPMRLYGVLLVFLGFSIGVSVVVLHAGGGLLSLGRPFVEKTQEFHWPMAVGNIMLQTFSVLGIPTLLMGMAFPVAVRVYASAGRIGGDLGRIYAVNTAGAILGSLAACFIIVPRFGLSGGLFVLAAVDILLGCIVLFRAPGARAHLTVLAPAGALGLLALVILFPPNRAMQELAAGEKLVHYEEGPLATVAVIKNNFGYNTIYVDGVGVAGTDPMLQTDQKSLAHMPMFLVDNPKRALTVGFGSGGASYSYLLHDRLDHVDCVEICGEVPNAAPALQAANHGFRDRNDPRYNIIWDDARTYLQYTDVKYDIIATDCTDLRYKSNANLYDLDYFRYCRSALNPGGAVVVWMPLGGLSEEVFKIALRTFHKVFPEMGVFFMDNEPTHYILLVGWLDKMKIDYRLFGDRIKEPDVKADLAELNLDDPIKLLSTFITGGEVMNEYLAGGEINTEDRPRIEFLSPKYGYQDQPVLDNLDSLMRVRKSIRPWIVEGSMPAQELARLERYEKALPSIIQGHNYYRKIEIESATRAYLAAKELTPEDKSLGSLLEWKELAFSARMGGAWAWIMLGRAHQLMGLKDQAVDDWDAGAKLIQQRGGPRDPYEQGLLRSVEQWRAEMKAK